MSRVTTIETYRVLLDAFREHPGAYRAAAKKADCDWRTAKGGWERGFPGSAIPEMRRPMHEILAEEQAKARARLQMLEELAKQHQAEEAVRRAEDERTKAQADQVAARASEAQLVRTCRNATQTLVVAVTGVASGLARCAMGAKRALDKHAEEEAKSPGSMSMGDVAAIVGLSRQLSGTLKSLVEAGQAAMEMDRLLLGEPTQIIGVGQLPELSFEEAEARIEAARLALERHTRKTAAGTELTVIEGGASVSS